jgi:hypothetical protein
MTTTIPICFAGPPNDPSDPAHGRQELQPERDGRVRCSALGRILCDCLTLCDEASGRCADRR